MGKVLSRVVVLSGLVTGLTLVPGPGDGAVAQEKADLPPDLARISGKAHFLASIRPADLWDSPLAKGVRAKVGADVTTMTLGVEEALGLPPAAIERVTVVMPVLAPGAEQPVFHVAAKAA